jgi:hypothetical protein
MNVTRNGNFRDGNVTALVWDLNTKKTPIILLAILNTVISTQLKIKGINSQLNFQKPAGNIVMELALIS